MLQTFTDTNCIATHTEENGDVQPYHELICSLIKCRVYGYRYKQQFTTPTIPSFHIYFLQQNIANDYKIK